MTLQYRIRSQNQDDKWRQKLQLCYTLIVQATDAWCLSNAKYPTENVVACVFYIFSPQCEPNDVAEQDLFTRFLNFVGTPNEEYAKVWPKRTRSASQQLTNSLITILDDAVVGWTDQGLQNSLIEIVVQQIADEIMHQQYVVFHHWESTRRDNNHWGIG